MTKKIIKILYQKIYSISSKLKEVTCKSHLLCHFLLKLKNWIYYLNLLSQIRMEA